MDRLHRVYNAIDAANAEDPKLVTVDGGQVPAAQIYGQRMTAMLEEFQPDASEVLKIAVRGQHIQRFKIPREDYPEGKAGYYRWRNEQKRQHAIKTGEIMAEEGYGQEDIDAMGTIVRKERPAENPDTQTLEDIAALVFLKYELNAFLEKYHAYTPEKYADILAKTWRKMSPKGHEAALALNPPEAIVALLHQGLAALEKA